MKLFSDFRQSATAVRVLALGALLALVSGCNYVPKVNPYRMEILQGNLVTQDMVSKLKPGMTKDQVRFALGTPLVVDTFRDDRWDYVFLHTPADSKVTERRHVTVYFEDGKLKRIGGDVVSGGTDAAGAQPAASQPTGTQPAAATATPSAGAPVVVTPLPESK